MVILGIDPGYATTGFGVVFSDRGNLKLLNYVCLLIPFCFQKLFLILQQRR